MLIESSSPQHTEQAGARLAAILRVGDSLGLIGHLGSGKTCFVRGLAAGLKTDPSYDVASPTFTIANEYPGPLPLLHFDLYRLDTDKDLYAIGIDDYWDRAAVFVFEWADKFDVLVPRDIDISFSAPSDTQRTLTMKPRSPRGTDILKAWSK